MSKIFIEENGVYMLDCTQALWATDELHEEYHRAGVPINDVDFVIENEKNIVFVEYKNANIEAAQNHYHIFNPMADKKFNNVIRKFYDSLHYLRLLNKTKPVEYIYILEYPKSDSVMRKRLRNRMKKKLPFALQDNIGKNVKLIEKVEVMSIAEWNQDDIYRRYPLLPVKN